MRRLTVGWNADDAIASFILSVVVHDLYLVGSELGPAEQIRYCRLMRMLNCPFRSPIRAQVDCRGAHEIIQSYNGIESVEFAESNLPQRLRTALSRSAAVAPLKMSSVPVSRNDRIMATL